MKPEWGQKRICQSCGASFYDLRRRPVVCPKCGAEVETETLPRTRRAKAPEPEKKPPRPTEKEAAAELGLEIEEPGKSNDTTDESLEGETETDNDELIEDASELGEDEDDMAEVINNVEDRDDKT